MFLGTFEHAIDSKGRLFLPAKFRGESAITYIVTRGLESCLYLYDAKDFQTSVLGKLQTLPAKSQEEARAFRRVLLAGAQEVTPDDAGRILIPRPLVEHAGLSKDVAILGVGERVELWSAARWASYSRSAAAKFQNVGRRLEI